MTDIETGAKNLLLSCVGARSGDRVLLVGEADHAPYFDPALCDVVAAVARRLGLTPEIVLAEPVPDADHFPTNVREAMDGADHTIFFSRLGDQVRFALGEAHAVMTYTLDPGYLADAFAEVDFQTAKAVHDCLLSTILEARDYRITAACGTDLQGRIETQSGHAVVDFAVELFPVMIFPPVTAVDLNGTLVLDHFVTSSSTRSYEDSVLRLEHPIRVGVEASRMVAFDGPYPLVDRVKRHLERAASLTGGDPFLINSWHTGINPNTYFNGDPHADLERWGTVAYGSPRYTHFHAAGRDPGDVAFHLFDATIAFDDALLWDQGRFSFLDRPDVVQMLGSDQYAMMNASIVRSIGI